MSTSQDFKAIIKKILHGIENSAILVSLFFIVALPATDMIGRKLWQTGNVNAAEYLNHMMIWFTMLGAMISSREGKHISLAVFEDMLPEKFHLWTRFLTSTVTATVLTTLAFASLDHFWLVSEGTEVGKLPQILFTIAFPIGFGVMALRAMVQKKWQLSLVTALFALIFPVFVLGVPTLLLEADFSDSVPGFIVGIKNLLVTINSAIVDGGFFGKIYVLLFILLFAATALGAPVFITLAGAAALLFYNGEQMLGYLPNESYEVLTDEIFPTIPLFTMAGFILSESKSGERLVAFFRALFGWVPGGLAIMAVLVCAFFTTFTGASGVTILALGGLLHYIMTKEGYSDRFTEGYLTASGSIGLLFAPSLPIILYGVQAQINIKHLFAGGLFPGATMILALSVYAVIRGRKNSAIKVEKFDIKEICRTCKGAAFEVMLPLIIVVLYFTGQATLIQTGVVAVIYMVIVNLVIHRDFTIMELPKIFLKAAPIAGSVLIILAAAKGLSFYIVYAEVPTMLTAWVSEYLDPSNPSSKIIFLLVLNVALLITGFFMDIFSAIIVVVPLILPISQTFGIGPVHLGIIFLANLELGYLTPPVGLNLFLSALRFEKPLVQIYRSVIPFLLILLVTVLVITYVPSVTYCGMRAFNFTTETSDTTHAVTTGEESLKFIDSVHVDSLGVITRNERSVASVDTVIVTNSSFVDKQLYKQSVDTAIVDTVLIDTVSDTTFFEVPVMDSTGLE